MNMLTPVKASVVTREYVLCPHCGEGDFNVSHLESGLRFGPWYCDDCGGSFVGQRQLDGTFEIELRTERKITTVDVLVLNPQDKPVYFVVEGMRFEGVVSVGERLRQAAERMTGRPTPPEEPRDEAESKRFFYEEHSCPTNWLEPIMVYHDGDDDPHGLIEFVRSVDSSSLPPDESYGPNDRDRAIVALIEST